MSDTKILRSTFAEAKSTGKVIIYPCGVVDVQASTSPMFGMSGWEKAEDYAHPKPLPLAGEKHSRKCIDPQGEDTERAMRRARGKLRRIALSNSFRWFVTLTIDPSKVDSHDGAAVVKKLNAWCSNMVQRKGLCYVLVPERHKKGGIHFHGFFNDCVEAVDSGHKDRQGHTIYNLPQWSLGFTTAIELYDDYQKAVAYVCKYIGKQGEKPAGRWYYSGGNLQAPQVEYCDLSSRELLEQYGQRAYEVQLPGKQLVIINGLGGDDFGL